MFDYFVGLALKELMVRYQINCVIAVGALCLLEPTEHLLSQKHMRGPPASPKNIVGKNAGVVICSCF